MKFIIDAQLPPALKHFFLYRGHDALHTLDLPEQNDTSDQDIRKLSVAENRIVLTKDADFYYSFVLSRQPPKLVLIKVGNMPTKELVELFSREIDRLLELLADHDFVTVQRDGIKP